MRVFHHECRHSGTFTVFERLHDRMVLAVRVEQVIVHARKIDLIECNSVRGRKRDPIIACNRFRNYLAARSLNNECMKLPVHVAISSLVDLDQVAL